MKNSLLRIITVLLILCALSLVACDSKIVPNAPVISQEFVEDGLAFMLGADNASYTVSNVTDKTKTDIVIPDTHNGLPVTRIGRHAFENHTEILSITLGNNVTVIDNHAFFGCNKLKKVVLGDSVESIRNYAFSGCSALESINIPYSIKNIGLCAFEGCTGVARTVGGVLYLDSCALRYDNSVSQVSLADGTRIICDSAFCVAESKLESITIPSSVAYIGDSAFWGCYSLCEISFDVGVKSIADNAFFNCQSLEEIHLPDGIQSIGSRAFYNCVKLKGVSVPDSIQKIGQDAFNNCSSLIFHNENKASYLGNDNNHCVVLFKMADKNQKSVKINDNTKILYDSALKDCSAISSLELPSDVRDIGSSAFSGCKKLKSITLPDSVINVGDHAFDGCSALTDVTVGSGVRTVGFSAFANCTKLSKVNIDDLEGWCGISFSHNTSNPLYYAKSLYINGKIADSIVIPDKIKAIKQYTFYGCTSVTNVIISDGVASIGGSAFYGCSKLASINISGSVKSIGDSAFYSCKALRQIRYSSKKDAWNSVHKVGKWNGNTGAYSVYCSDGTVAK
ncbi:MAG: leucine-rich repeat domain-containing protein [Ruminococcaceae bacterium]|nr:leucine-rich repeat domain-containing protein [Oscillospiraceae bacterium]